MSLPVGPYLQLQSWNIYRWSGSDPKYRDRYSDGIGSSGAEPSRSPPPWREALLPTSLCSSGRAGSHHLDTNLHIESTDPGRRFDGKQKNHPPPPPPHTTPSGPLQPVLETLPRQRRRT